MGVCLVFESDYYKVLEVDPEADPEVIAAAYAVLAKQVRAKADLEEADQIRLAELDLAYAVLSNPAQRRAFDERRLSETVAVGPGYHGNGNGDGHVYDAAARLAAGPLSERVAAGLHGESLGELTINFGRYAGWTLSEIAGSDPEYLMWLSRHSSGIRYRRAILRLLREREEKKSTLHVQPTP